MVGHLLWEYKGAKVDFNYVHIKPTHIPTTATKIIRWAASKTERLTLKVNVRRLETSDETINCRTAPFSWSFVYAPDHRQVLQAALLLNCLYTASEATLCTHAAASVVFFCKGPALINRTRVSPHRALV